MHYMQCTIILTYRNLHNNHRIISNNVPFPTSMHDSGEKRKSHPKREIPEKKENSNP